MGWDIVAIGTNHDLPIEDPLTTARRLMPLCPGPISIGYFSEWEYDRKENRITDHYTGWREMDLLCSEKDGETVKFILHDADALQLYEEVKERFDEVRFEDKDQRGRFMSDVTDRYALYELESESNWHPNNRVFLENVDLSVDFPGRWPQFERLFRSPYEGMAKEILDAFRKDIHRQMKLCGSDHVYFFPDQGYGEFIYNRINLPSKEWLAYLMSGRHIEEAAENGEAVEPLRIINIVDYIEGRTVLGEKDYIHCFIDDFSDF